jgi:hypothetical protein
VARETVRVRGLRELDRALKNADADLSKGLRDELKEAGELVRDEARQRFLPIQPRSAESFTVRVRGGGQVFVEQRRRRTTGLRPDFGVLQMQTALLPALEAREGDVIRKVDDLLDRIARDFN